MLLILNLALLICLWYAKSISSMVLIVFAVVLLSFLTYQHKVSTQISHDAPNAQWMVEHECMESRLSSTFTRFITNRKDLVYCDDFKYHKKPQN